MRFPWVSRELYESAQRESETHRDQARMYQSKLFEAWDRITALAAKAVEVPAAVTAPEKAKADPVTQAIITKAGGNRRLRKHYADFVTLQRAAGMDDDEIADRIRVGETDDQGVPG